MTTIVAPPWEEQLTGGGIADAPTDGKTYGRKYAAWEEVVSAAKVGDIVAASALPLPDVWAPLSDSLRMITGYGREVKVGEDVVARMVNFSRSTTATYIGKDGLLKTAAVNEPRFEKEGLLIEGQRTNLVPFSDNFSSYISKPTVTTPESDGFTVFDLDRIAYTGSASSLTVGAIYTISALVDVSGPCVMRIGFGGQNRDVTISAAMRGVISLSANCASNDGALVRIGPISRNAGVTIRVRYLQLEALPLASSYIPTNGAAATRAADMATLPQSLNLGESQLGFSLAVDFDSVNPGPYRVISLSDYSTVMGDGANIYIRHAGREIGPLPAQLGKRNRLAYTVDLSGVITACINGAQITAPSRNAGAPGSNEKIMFGNHINTALNLALEGHLRDLKIWTKKPLTADQLKVASA